jgi:hypothetical protein
MNVYLKVVTPLTAIQLDNFEEIHNYENPVDYAESPDVELWLNDKLLLRLSFEEACELAGMSSHDFEIGLEYCTDVHGHFDAWRLAEENFATHNYEDAITDMILSSSMELQGLSQPLLNHFDFQAYWESDVRHDYTVTDSYIFHSR